MPPPTTTDRRHSRSTDALADSIERAGIEALPPADEIAAAIVRQWAITAADAVRADLPAALADALALHRHPDDNTQS